jgi:hypothetical protein
MTIASTTYGNVAETNVLTAKASGSAEPIVIDLGKKTRKQVRKLRRGKPSRLLDRVQEVLAEVAEANTIPNGAQTVVVVVREKPRKSKVGKLWGLG